MIRWTSFYFAVGGVLEKWKICPWKVLEFLVQKRVRTLDGEFVELLYYLCQVIFVVCTVELEAVKNLQRVNTDTVKKQCDFVCRRFHLELSNDHICFHTFQLSATFPVVTNFPEGIIPAIAPKGGCCTSPGCACSGCEEPGDGASGAVSESEIATPQLFQLRCATL